MTPRPIRILISSPGDVAEERAKAQQVIADLGRLYGAQADLESVLWEDLALPVTASFQESIDYFLLQKPIDIAVFILWSRLGSPLGVAITRPDGSAYRSGTERELDLMLTAFEQSDRQRPLILAYTRDDESTWKKALSECQREQLEEMIYQQRLAESFIREQFHDQEGRNIRAYHSYREPVSFAQRLRTHLRAAIDDLLASDTIAPRWTEPPYRSLEVFDVQHAPIFFGRSEEICDVIDRIRKQHESGSGFVVIVGASGSGKSSLARAGVAASLVQHAYDDSIRQWRSVVFTPANFGENLIRGLVLTIAEALPEIRSSSASIDDIADGLTKATGTTIKLALVPVFKQVAERAGGEIRLLIVLDQMEELWTDRRISEQYREQFLEVIEALTKKLYVDVVATLRSDFYAQAQSSPAFLKLKSDSGQIDLVAPSTTALYRMIVEPARMAGFRFERDERTGKTLDQLILEEASSDRSALPLLQFALSELYDRRNGDERTLTFAAYQHMGGVMGAIGQQATNMFAKLPESTQAALYEILPLIVSVDSENENEAVRRRALLSELTTSTDRRALTEALIAARFLTTDREGAEPIISIAHEALLTRWDALSKWVNVNRSNLRLRATIEQSQKRWEQSNRDASLLLSSGLPLEEGRQLLNTASSFLSPLATSFVQMSIEHIKKQERHRTNQRKMIFASMATLTLLTTFGGTYAWFQRNAAARQAILADTAKAKAERAETHAIQQEGLAKKSLDELAEQAKNASKALFTFGESEYQANRFENGIDKLTNAWRLRSNDDPLKELYKKIVTDRITRGGRSWHVFRYDGVMGFATFLKDSRRLAITFGEVVDGYGMRILDAMTGTPYGEPIQGGTSMYSFAFSPDGNRFAIGSEAVFQIWDTTTGMPLGPQVRSPETVTSIAFNPDGRRVAIVGGNTVYVWDSRKETLQLESMRDEGDVRFIEFSPDGNRVVTITLDNTVRISDAITGTLLSEPTRHEGSFRKASLSKDGRRLAIASYDTVSIIDAITGKLICGPMNHEGEITGVAFHPDCDRIATSCRDKTTRIWDSLTGKLIGEPLLHEAEVFGVVYSADGSLIATSSENTAQIWDLRTGNTICEPFHHENTITSLTFSPEGSRLATVSMDKTARIWDVLRCTFFLDPSQEEVYGFGYGFEGIAFSSDSRCVAIAVADSVQIWDLRTSMPLSTPIRHEPYIQAIAFSSDGLRLTTSTDDKTRQWEVSTYLPLGEPIETVLIPQDGTEANGRDSSKIYRFAQAPNMLRRLTVSYDNTIRIVDLLTGMQLCEPLRNEDEVKSVKFCADGSRFATVLENKSVRIRNALNGELIGDLVSDEKDIKLVEFNPSGRKIVIVNSDDIVRMWDIDTDEKTELPIRKRREVKSVVFGPDGRSFAIAWDDSWVFDSNEIGVVQICDVASGLPIGQKMKHSKEINHMSFSPDGCRLATASDDCSARIWDATTGAPLLEPMQHGGSVTHVAFSPDGCRLITRSEDKTLRLWDVESFLPKNTESLVNHFADSSNPSNHQDLEFEDELVAFQTKRIEKYRRTTATRAVAEGNWFTAKFHLPWLCEHEPNEVCWRAMLATTESAMFAEKCEWNEALKQAERAVEMQPTMNAYRAHWLCSLANNELESIALALEQYLGFAERNKFERVWSNVVNDLNLLENLDLNRKRIHALAEKAVLANERSKQFRISLGGSFYRMEKFEQAEKTLAEAIGDSEVSYEAHAFLAMTYHKLNQLEKSAEQQELMANFPEPTEWQERLRYRLLRDEVEKTCKVVPSN